MEQHAIRPGRRSIEHAGLWALGHFRHPAGSSFPGLVRHDRVLDLSCRDEVGRPASPAGLFNDWDGTLPRLEQLANVVEGWVQLAGLEVLSPVEPRQVFQAGANYRSHVLDLVVAHHTGADGRTAEQVRADAAAHMDDRLAMPPFVFQGLPSAICGAFDDVVIPYDAEQLDWELELAVVIGRRARRIPAERALEFVAGWTIANDLTLREKVFRKDSPGLGADWLGSKNRPTFLPVGPVVVPHTALLDPGDLRVTLNLNGEVMQDASTAELIFGVSRLVAYCSEVATLLPGDILLTGSPAGNGLAHGRLLRAGDVMDSTISGLGAQSNRCVDEIRHPSEG